MKTQRRYLVYIYTQYKNGALRPNPLKRSYNKLPKTYKVSEYLTVVSVNVFDSISGEWPDA